jgi:NADH-quinone oxidoreductase subunit N
MTITQAQWIALLPLLLSCLTAVAVMLAIAWKRNHAMNAAVCIIGLTAALLSVRCAWVGGAQQVTALLVVDGYACLYMAMVLFASIACCTFARGYLEGYNDEKEELYLLIATAAAGAVVLACAQHMASFFIGLELMSIPLYGMIAYQLRQRHSLEAGVKYLVLSVAASAMLLFGMALLYADTGALGFTDIGTRIAAADEFGPLVVLGAALILIGAGFKLSLVPFHAWTPDVYEGAPAPVTAFLASVSKVAVLAVFLRFLLESPVLNSGLLNNLLAGLAVLSILVGNLLALQQNNIKRLIGYSSIAHFGYLMIAVVAQGRFALESVGMYLVTYIVAALGTLGVVALVSSPFSGKDADAIHNYRGLFWKHPYLASVLTVMMLSLAGIPVTAGFIGKFYVAVAGVDAGLWGMLAALVVGSAIGLFYYLRVMVALFVREPHADALGAPARWNMRSGGWMVMALILLTLWLGVYPQPMVELVQAATIAGSP